MADAVQPRTRRGGGGSATGNQRAQTGNQSKSNQIKDRGMSGGGWKSFVFEGAMNSPGRETGAPAERERAEMVDWSGSKNIVAIRQS